MSYAYVSAHRLMYILRGGGGLNIILFMPLCIAFAHIEQNSDHNIRVYGVG